MFYLKLFPDSLLALFERRLVATALAVITIGSTTVGCTGPHTPLGGLRATNSSDVRSGPMSLMTSYFELDRNKRRAEVSFDPPTQSELKKNSLQIKIHDDIGIKEKYQFIVRYNGIDVTSGFLRESAVNRESPKDVTYQLKNVYLDPDKNHHVEVIYGDPKDWLAYARWSK